MFWLLVHPEAQLGNSSLANRILQLIYAKSITSEMRNIHIIHQPFPEFKIKGSTFFKLTDLLTRVIKKIKVDKFFDLEISLKQQKKNLWNPKIFGFISGLNLQIRDLKMKQEWARTYFVNTLEHECCPSEASLRHIVDSYNVAHIRLGDIIVNGVPRRRDYHPLPISFYKDIEKLSSKPFAFVFQDNSLPWYTTRMLAEFENSVAIEMGCIHRDFWLLRNSKEVTIATSTFSFLAAWLSNDAVTIWIPNAGFLNQSIRPDIDLLSSNDSRFKILEVKSPPLNTQKLEFRRYLSQ
jgi:hypothetical protein